MITIQELLKGKKLEDQPREVQDNLEELLERLNKLRLAYGKPITITSGLRDKEDMIRIYAAKGITDESKIPWGSKHCSGEAADLSDPNKEIQTFIKANLPLIEGIGFWMEDFASTPNWAHCQIVPPKSGNRFFKP